MAVVVNKIHKKRREGLKLKKGLLNLGQNSTAVPSKVESSPPPDPMDVDDEPRESTQAEPRQSIPPVQPGHVSPTQPSPQRGTILAKEGTYVLIDWGTRIEVRSASQINEGDFETPETGIATTFAPADDYDLLKQLKKRDQSNFVSNVESVLDTDPYRGKRVLYLVKYRGEQRKLRCGKSNMGKLFSDEELATLLQKGSSSASASPPATPSPPARPSSSSSQQSGDTPESPPPSESTQAARQQSIPPVQPEHIKPSPQRGTILAKEGAYVLIDWGTRFEVRSALQIDEGDFETPGAGIADTFAPADDLKTLKQLKKDDKSEFVSKLKGVWESNVYRGNRVLFLVKYEGKPRKLRCGKSNISKLFSSADLEMLLQKGNSSATASPPANPSTPARPSSSSSQQSGDTPESPPPSESTQAARQQSSPPVQPEHISPTQPSSQRGTILAKEGTYVLIDWGNCIKVQLASELNDDDFEKPETGIATTFAPADDHDILKQLKKNDESNFVSNVESVLETNAYRGNRVLFLVKYKGQQRKLRCGKSNMSKLFSSTGLEALLQKGRSSATASPPATPSPPARPSNSSSPPSGGHSPGAAGVSKQIMRCDSVMDSVEPVEAVPTRSPIVPESLRDEDAHYVVVAKNILACRKDQGKPVTDGTHCIVRDQRQQHRYLTWSEIQSKRNRLSNSSIQDEDYGHGLHPDADRAFLRGLTGDRKLRPTDYDVKDAIMYRSKGGSETGVYYITVFLELKGEKWNALLESREVRHYNYEGPARSSRTTFLQAGGKEEDFAGILNDRQPEMWQEYLKKRENGGAREVSPLPEGIDTGRLEARLGRLEARLETFVGMMANLMETINHRGS